MTILESLLWNIYVNHTDLGRCSLIKLSISLSLSHTLSFTLHAHANFPEVSRKFDNFNLHSTIHSLIIPYRCQCLDHSIKFNRRIRRSRVALHGPGELTTCKYFILCWKIGKLCNISRRRNVSCSFTPWTGREEARKGTSSLLIYQELSGHPHTIPVNTLPMKQYSPYSAYGWDISFLPSFLPHSQTHTHSINYLASKVATTWNCIICTF